MRRVAIIAAMPGELKPLVRGWNHEKRNGVDLWHRRHDKGEWVAACAGAGLGAATRAFAQAEKDGELAAVISSGWAGALSNELAPGSAYRVCGAIDARTGERFETNDLRSHPGDNDKIVGTMGHTDLWVVTSATVADEPEKQRLATTYGAALVDMEAAGVARLAAMRGIPFYCVKGVSDGFTAKLPDFNRFLSQNGKFQLGRFVLFAIMRPWHWPALIRMGENSKKASRHLAESLLDFLNETGAVRHLNGDPTL